MKLRILTEEQFSRVLYHFNLIHKNNIMLTESFREIHENEILSFVLRYIKPPMQHFMALQDDCSDIAKYLKSKNIKYPILYGVL